tara:strand:- start:66816 stop:67487 length:672 start_codon:yes stop_codon:yes gene_type:complete
MKNINLPASYFINRHGNDKKRLASFIKEKEFISNLFSNKDINNLKVLDIGCSTGEFLNSIFSKNSNLYGIEPSEYASCIASENGIKIIKDINIEEDYDLIIYRGTIQYIPNPFESIDKSFQSLKVGGKILFLATPNIRSLYYLLFKSLPFLEEEMMYWVPSDVCLRRTLRNCGFSSISIYYPYFSSPYSQPIMDIIKFFIKLFTRIGSFPFPGNMIWVSAIKK